MQKIEIRTGIWYNDHPIHLTFPDSWDVVTHWPNTPEPLTNEEITQRINNPVGQRPLHELAKGKRAPVIIVDDLARPTPVFSILPFLLEQFRMAGVPLNAIRILVATGTHGEQNEKGLANKIGKEAMESCRIIVHDDTKHTKFVGKTSFGTPVYVNREVASSDLVIGVGGVYPQHTVGFGGGCKLALGILGRKSIMHLHYTHESVDGNYNIDNSFRKDLAEIARMIGLNTIYTVHTNAYLQVVSLMSGDHYAYFPDAARFSRERYFTERPDDADVVIANAYPFDSSFTFMRKAYKALDCAPANATRVMVASNYEGIGTHGLFQHMTPPRFLRYRILYRRIMTMEPRVILEKIMKRLTFQKRTRAEAPEENYKLPVNAKRLWVYRPVENIDALPDIEGITVTSSWDEIMDAISREQSSHGAKLKVRVYPCAALQCMDAPSSSCMTCAE